MMTVLSWILLGLTIVDVPFAIVLLLLLRARKLTVDQMKPTMAFLFVVVPALIALILAITSLNLPLQLHPHAAPVSLIVGYMALASVIVFQVAFTKQILRKGREWNADMVVRRDEVMSRQ